jgi:hypothetical protein
MNKIRIKIKMWFKYGPPYCVWEFIDYWFLKRHPPRGISRVRWHFDYYVGRNSLGPPYYGVWCIRNFLWNTGITEWIKEKTRTFSGKQ